jgi:dTDP-4-amino-4,6-dideoxygalactose transaminase
MIPVFKPCYGAEELEALKEPFKTGWIGLGPKTKEFEKQFAEYVGTKYAVATNSCTASLHLAMKVMNIEDYEVITTPMTFVSTNHAILYNNGIPVFADIHPDTLNINPDEIKKLITQKTKAIVTVHYGGHPCDMETINELAKKHNLAVIEDVNAFGVLAGSGRQPFSAASEPAPLVEPSLPIDVGSPRPCLRSSVARRFLPNRPASLGLTGPVSLRAP